MAGKRNVATSAEQLGGTPIVPGTDFADARSDSTVDTIDGGDGDIPVIDPAVIFGDGGNSGNGESAEPVKRRRGRPAGGGKAGTTQKDKAVSVTGIEKLLLSTHNMLAKLTHVDEMKLDSDEARMIAEALANVQQHYNVVVDPKYLAWMGLIGVCLTIYGPRMAILVISKKNGKKSNDASPPDNVVQHKPVAVPTFDPNAFASKSGGM